jgi:hypothetical protein
MRDDSLNVAFTVTSPQNPTDQVLVGAVWVVSQLKEPMIDEQPIPAFPMKMLLAIGITDGPGLGCREVARLLGGDD